MVTDDLKKYQKNTLNFPDSQNNLKVTKYYLSRYLPIHASINYKFYKNNITQYK